VEESYTNRRPVDRIKRPFDEFTRSKSAGGIVLLAAVVAAMVWANSPQSASYFALWETHFSVGFEGAVVDQSLLHWINDGLMAVFFLLVGLEIKREVLVGELASLRAASLPIAAAVGGMVVPALIYTAFNFGGEGAAGWGIPMATDIAFAVGAISLLGRRVPVALKVFLVALAIVDDIGAVLVIAIFYSSDLSLGALGTGLGVVALLVLANLAGVRNPVVYGVLGLVLWFEFLLSGVHATIAGVLLAFTIPARPRIDASEFLQRGRKLLDIFEQSGSGSVLENERRGAAVIALEDACEGVETPLQRMEHGLHNWVNFLILPLFAFANAGVALGGDLAQTFVQPVALGVIFGLLLGKPIGVTLFSWLAVKAGLAALPPGMRWRQIHGAGWLAGIGFTMSLFIASLAFGEGSELLDQSKTAILSASLLAGAIGFFLLRSTDRNGDERAKT